MRAVAFAAAFLCLTSLRGSADELSGADKLRVVWSPQFSWTTDGRPLVTVGIAMANKESVTIEGPLSIEPDGEGGPSVRGGNRWTIRLDGKSTPGKLRYHVIVQRFGSSATELDALHTAQTPWKERGFTPRTVELGALFALHGEVLDNRQRLLSVQTFDSEADAKRAATDVHNKFSADAFVHTELAERPHAMLIAEDERGTIVRNDSILWLAPTNANTGALEVKGVHREAGGAEDRRYLGRIYVTVDARGELAVVNAVPEDKLLAGLVPAEMPPSSPPEALRAQAVAARNELFAKLGTRHLSDPYRLCSQQHCQVYAGAGHEDARATKAVEATAGELLVTSDGRLVDAVYSSSCGGHSEDNERVWGGTADSSLRGVLDAPSPNEKFATITDENLRAWLATTGMGFCSGGGRGAEAAYRWKTEIDLAKAREKLGVARLTNLVVTERGVSGRANKLRVEGGAKPIEIIGELAIRRALGNLKSGMFALDLERDASGAITRATATGGGHGHGIGMCQYGAAGRAQAGQTYREILKSYYSGATIKKFY